MIHPSSTRYLQLAPADQPAWVRSVNQPGWDPYPTNRLWRTRPTIDTLAD